jgi:hypothetical protein
MKYYVTKTAIIKESDWDVEGQAPKAGVENFNVLADKTKQTEFYSECVAKTAEFISISK